MKISYQKFSDNDSKTNWEEIFQKRISPFRDATRLLKIYEHRDLPQK